ncbi:MAG: 50S ribosomal protein L5 [Methanomicrobiales archaeon]|nr:50S ribosomal protein L5 [Methanomicrobiales archaeon]MDD1660135.1 50S ribosomal protein L5 [Methanomicrobiales archaeon]
MNPMQKLHIGKVMVHMGVGDSGEKLVKAEEVMKQITTQTPVRAIARTTQPAFSVRKGAPIGCKVTLRGGTAAAFMETALSIIDRKLSRTQFDKQGNFSFGIEEHTDFPGMAYDPAIGIFGMDVNVVLERPGARVARRKVMPRRLPRKQRVTADEAISFLQEAYKVEVQ